TLPSGGGRPPGPRSNLYIRQNVPVPYWKISISYAGRSCAAARPAAARKDPTRPPWNDWQKAKTTERKGMGAGVCGRYTLTDPGEELIRHFQLPGLPQEYRPRYNIAPTQPVLAIIDADGRRAGMLRWGLIPSWAKDPAIGNRMINARAETVAEKPSFRTALRRRRCLIPADGFYEWRTVNGRKQPMRIV